MINTNTENKLSIAFKQPAVLYNIAAIFLGSLLIAIAAQITILIHPVPVTLETFAVLFMGAMFGPRLGGAIVLAFLCEGLVGLPVFANFQFGIAVLLGPKGGYLIGFLPAAILTGYLLEKGWAQYRTTIFLAGLIGTIVLFIPGYFMLARLTGPKAAYLFGVAPFYIGEFCKLVLLAFLAPFFPKKKSR